MSNSEHKLAWPEPPADGWLETCGTVHMWAQIVGKIRLARAPMLNHWWQATLYVTARGLTTSPIPDRAGTFQIDFDFLHHQLLIATSDGRVETLPLRSCPLPEFYREILAALSRLGIEVRIWPVPVEVIEAVPFTADRGHSTYQPDIAERLWRMFAAAESVMQEFRGGFLGKSSPVHLFWGALDLAVTRFSGERAPEHPGGVPNLPDRITRDSYSHAVISCGFWPGTAGVFERPAFYAYAYPEPPGLAAAQIAPKQAYYHPTLREFLLPYDEVRASASPRDTVMDFLRSTYAAAAGLAGWNRTELER